MNFQMFKLVLEKAETRDQIAHIRWIVGKAREFQKNIYFSFIEYAKAFDCVDHNKLWKILQEMELWDHVTCLLRNLYADLRRRHSLWRNRINKPKTPVAVTV